MNKIKDIVSSICLFFLLLNPVLAQTTAGLLPEGKVQFLDNNGNPLSSGKVYFYVPSTTTFKTTWQDAGKTIANTNPVTLDAGGRAIIYGDGIYRQKVNASNGNLIYDVLTSSAGSGGNTPTSFGDGAAVGSIKPWAGLTPPVNYVYSYGQELSRSTYSVLFAAITLIQNLSCASGSPILTGLADTSQIPVGAILESTCMAAGSTVISKTTTTVTMNTNSSLTTSTTGVFFLYGNGNGTTTFNVPDLRGNVIAGRCNMGGTDCINLTTTGLGETASATGAVGGSQTKVITTPNLPAYTPTGTVTAVAATGTVSTPTITLSAASTNVVNTGAGGSANLTGGGGALLQATITASSSTPIFTGTGGTATFTGAAQGGTATAFSLVQPTMTLNYVIKILPDVSLSTTSVVTSLGGMQGDITCGTWLICTTQDIAVNISAPAATFLGNPTSAGAIGTLFTIQGLTNQASPDPNNDFLPIYHAATGTIQKVTAGTLGSIGVAGVSSFNGRVGGVSPLNNDYNSTLVPTIQPAGTGPVSRTSAAKMNDIINIKDYGAACDGVTDDAAAINFALSYAGSLSPNSGGQVHMPPGCQAKINSSILIHGRVCLIGGGMDSTKIIGNFDTVFGIVIMDGEGACMHDLGIGTLVNRTSGPAISLGTGSYEIHHIDIIGSVGTAQHYDGIRDIGSVHGFIHHVKITNAVHDGLRIDGTNVATTQYSNFDIEWGGTTGGAHAGISIYANGGFIISDSTSLGFNFGLLIQANGNNINDNIFSNILVDHNIIGVQLEAIAGTVARQQFSNCQFTSSTQQNFVQVTTAGGLVSGTYVVNSQATNSISSDGVQLQGAGSTDFTWVGGLMANNAGNGFKIVAASTHVTIVGARSGNGGLWGGNAGFGIQTSIAACDYIIFSNNDLSGNGSGTLDYHCTGVHSITTPNL